MKTTRGERIFYRVNEIFLVLVGLICLAPMVHTFAISFSANEMVVSGQVAFWPKKFTLIGYEYLIQNVLFWKGMFNSIFRVLLGVCINIFFTVLAAYPLSKETTRFKHRTFYAWFFFIPMIFGGGLIPTFILVKDLKLMNSILALVLPGAVPIFYVLVMLNFFRGLPVELEEAALIDGASQWKILFRIYVPLSLPAMATISVYAVVGHWNSWFDGLIYMNDPNKYPLMTYLQTAVISIDYDNLTAEEIEKLSLLGDRTYKAAQLFLGALPVLIAYPFFQKYFTKGLVLGSVKG